MLSRYGESFRWRPVFGCKISRISHSHRHLCVVLGPWINSRSWSWRSLGNGFKCLDPEVKVSGADVKLFELLLENLAKGFDLISDAGCLRGQGVLGLDVLLVVLLTVLLKVLKPLEDEVLVVLQVLDAVGQIDNLLANGGLWVDGMLLLHHLFKPEFFVSAELASSRFVPWIGGGGCRSRCW